MKNHYFVQKDKLVIYLNPTYIAVDDEKHWLWYLATWLKKGYSSNAVSLLNSICPTLARKTLYISRLILSIALKDSLRCFVSKSDIS
jgi:hypothetical protein